MPFWNCPAETSLPFSEGAESFMFGFQKIHVALVLGCLLQASAECQLVSIKLFSSMTFAQAWISRAADVQCVLPDKLSITTIFLILPSVPAYCVFFNIKIVRHIGKEMSFCCLFCFLVFAWHYLSVVLGQDRNADLTLCVCSHIYSGDSRSVSGPATQRTEIRIIGGELFANTLLVRKYLLTTICKS